MAPERLRQIFADVQLGDWGSMSMLAWNIVQSQVDAHNASAKSRTRLLSLAEITAARWTKLLAKNAVSKQETDQATSDLKARQSALAAAESNVKRLQQLQGFEKIYAPFDGVITARNIDIGSLIQGGDSNSPQAELFHMSATDKLRLFVPVPEVYASQVRTGSHIAVTSDALPNQKFVGVVARNSNASFPPFYHSVKPP